MWEDKPIKVTEQLFHLKKYSVSVAFSPNGKIVASASADGRVRLCSLEDGSCLIAILGCDDIIPGAMSLVFSPDGRMLAFSGIDGTVRLWNPHEEDRNQFTQASWGAVFLLWNFPSEQRSCTIVASEK